jgi:very-short-patch-repair endonuclease
VPRRADPRHADRVPHDLTRPFTARMVRDEIPWSTVRGPRFRRLLPTVYVAREVEVTPRLMAEAAALVLPGTAWLSHSTAASLQGLPVPHDVTVHACVPSAADRRLRGTLTVRVRPRPATAYVDNLLVTTGPDLFGEMGELVGLVDLVVLGDAMVARRLATPARLMEAATTLRHSHRAAVVRAASLVRARVDSPMETRLRLLLVLAGLPEPQVNPEIRGDGFRTRVDLCYPQLQLVIEYDGQQHRADDLTQWDRDNDRLAWFAQHGWEVLPVISRGIYRRPGETLARVCDAIVRRGGVVPELDPQWRLHFPAPAA